MNSSNIVSNPGRPTHPHPFSKGSLAAVLFALIGMTWHMPVAQAQDPGNDVQGAQVLTRGPVHEAFAGMVTFNPQPGVLATKAPPEVIEELPPDERPEGDNVTWIPGYWGWDDERSDFLWVSGTWRALPPGRQWRAGYWAKTTQGFQWTSGYWAEAEALETTYLPPPPATIEAGPNIAAPSIEFAWTPGCWIWHQERYAWRPGYWAQGRADWDWMPAHYVWTPRGYIFAGGFWDYPVARRGILFAPVYFDVGVYSRRGYSYSPTIAIDLGVFNDHLFLRPSYQHYYFGDYYAPSYSHGGFYASFSFQASRSGYDPLFSQQRWEHRQDREWEHRAEVSFQYRRDHEVARPPRTWIAQRTVNPSTAEARQNHLLVAAPIAQMAKSTTGTLRFQPVAIEERQKLAQRGQEVQQSRDQRRTLEAAAAGTPSVTPGAVAAPAKLQLPPSPIMARPARQLTGNQIPPQAQRAPQPDPRLKTNPESSARPPAADKTNPQSQPRNPEPEKKPAPGRKDVVPPVTSIVPPPESRSKPIEKTAVPPAEAVAVHPEQPAPERAKVLPAPTPVKANAEVKHEPSPVVPPQPRAVVNSRPPQPVTERQAWSKQAEKNLKKQDNRRKTQEQQTPSEKPAGPR